MQTFMLHVYVEGTTRNVAIKSFLGQFKCTVDPVGGPTRCPGISIILDTKLGLELHERTESCVSPLESDMGLQ